MKFLKNFFFIVLHFLKNSFIFLINPRNKKLLEIFSASKCAYLELSTVKIKNLGVFLVNTPRVNFGISMALAFRSKAPPLNLKILKSHYHGVKIHKNGTIHTRVQKNFLFFDAVHHLPQIWKNYFSPNFEIFEIFFFAFSSISI